MSPATNVMKEEDIMADDVYGALDLLKMDMDREIAARLPLAEMCAKIGKQAGRNHVQMAKKGREEATTVLLDESVADFHSGRFAWGCEVLEDKSLHIDQTSALQLVCIVPWFLDWFQE